MDSKEFRRLGYEMIDWLADYFDNVEQYPVCSPLQPGEVKAAISASPPDEGEPLERAFADFKKTIMPGITHWQHPGWFAYFPSNNSPPSVLAELLSAGLGAQCMIWQTSPAAAELEEVVMDWLRQLLGLPVGMSGVIQDTASTSTLCALLSAREKATDYEVNRRGFNAPLRVYTSGEAHSSIDKAVKIAGYGIENLRRIPVGSDFAMLPGELEKAIAEDLAAGLKPACAVATLGTTSSAAIDPLEPIASICRRRGVWLHVDAAYGGSAAMLEEKRGMLKGAEMIDSFVFNPHKWLLTNFDCSAYFVRDEEALIRTFEIHPEYLKTGHDSVVKNYRDWGIQLGRRFRALKLWFVIRAYGASGLKELLRGHLTLAALFKGLVEADSRFELAAPVHLALVCFRLKKEGAAPEEEDMLNADLLARVNASGQVYLTHTSLNGRYTIRLSVGQRSTEERHVRQAWQLISAGAEACLSE